MTLSIRPYQPGDDEAIVEFLDEAFEGWPKFDLPCSPLDHWRWKFLDNPLRIPIVALALSDDQIVGSTHGLVQQLKIGGRVFLSCLAVDSATHSDFRGIGIFTKLYSLREAIMISATIRFPYAVSTNSIIIDALKREGHRVLPFTLETLLRIRDLDLHFQLAPAERSSWKKYGFRVLRLLHRLQSATPSTPPDPSAVRITEVARFDERIDDFWAQIRTRYQFIVVRDREYLNWRYCDPRGGHYVVFVAEVAAQLAGYAVLRINRYREDYPVGYIVDLLALPDQLDVLHTLAQTAVAYFDQEDINKIQVNTLKGSAVESLFHGMGFIHHPHKPFMNSPLAYRNEALDGIDHSDVNAMHFAYGDYDWI